MQNSLCAIGFYWLWCSIFSSTYFICSCTNIREYRLLLNAIVVIYLIGYCTDTSYVSRAWKGLAAVSLIGLYDNTCFNGLLLCRCIILYPMWQMNNTGFLILLWCCVLFISGQCSLCDGRQQRVRRPSHNTYDGRQQRVWRPPNHEDMGIRGEWWVCKVKNVMA